MAEQDDEQYDPRQQLFTTLLRKVERDTYPSTTVMDLIEEIADDRERAAYCRVLLEKVQRDEFPSLDLIKRVSELC